MLPLDAPDDANFLSPETTRAVQGRLAGGGGGLISEDRLRRNLLSSQPMCFNFFGHFRSDPDALLPWVQRIAPGAITVVGIEIEWAPPPEEHFDGGSAFDALVEYETQDGLGFLGVECKYHEHLPRTDVKNVRQIYKDFTVASGLWQPGADAILDRPGFRQFWLNTLLVQSLAATDRYVEGKSVVVACAADRSARAHVDTVQDQLVEPTTLAWTPWEAVSGAVHGHDEQVRRFRARYLDFTPVRDLLDPDDPRRIVGDPLTALHIAERVLGEGGILDQLARQGITAPDIWSRLGEVVEELKRIRIDASRYLPRNGEA